MRFGRKGNQVVSSASVPESQSAPVPAAGALAPPLAAVDNADIEVDSESDDDLMAEVADQVAEERSVTEVMLNATATRITPVTRKLYDSHLRQMAVWEPWMHLQVVVPGGSWHWSVPRTHPIASPRLG